MKKKKNYLVVQFRDPDVDVQGTTSFLVDKRGNIVRKYLGEPDFADLEQRIQQALSAG